LDCYYFDDFIVLRVEMIVVNVILIFFVDDFSFERDFCMLQGFQVSVIIMFKEGGEMIKG
jgi:hypothetical protein